MLVCVWLCVRGAASMHGSPHEYFSRTAGDTDLHGSTQYWRTSHRCRRTPPRNPVALTTCLKTGRVQAHVLGVVTVTATVTVKGAATATALSPTLC